MEAANGRADGAPQLDLERCPGALDDDGGELHQPLAGKVLGGNEDVDGAELDENAAARTDGRALQLHEVGNRIGVELVCCGLLREREAQNSNGSSCLDAESRRSQGGCGATVEQSPEQLPACSPFDVATSSRPQQVECREPAGVEQRLLCTCGKPGPFHHPDRSQQLSTGTDRHRKPWEDVALAGDAYHPRCSLHLAVDAVIARELRNPPPEDALLTCLVDGLTGKGGVRQHPAMRVLDGDGPTDHRGDRIREGEQIVHADGAGGRGQQLEQVVPGQGVVGREYRQWSIPPWGEVVAVQLHHHASRLDPPLQQAHVVDAHEQGAGAVRKRIAGADKEHLGDVGIEPRVAGQRRDGRPQHVEEGLQGRHDGQSARGGSPVRRRRALRIAPAFFEEDEETRLNTGHSGLMTLAPAAVGTVVDSAVTAADQAMRRAHVTVLELRAPAETDRAAELLRQVWRGPEAPVPANLLRTVQHIGGYVFGAYDESGALVAASMGLLATEGLHSHITGVVPAGQRRGLGFALKQHQRVWALERGMSTISWTCDPLVRRNMAFNLHALGATVEAYLPDHYGEMTDGVNKGDESDRFELRWDLMSEPAVAAGSGRLPWVVAGPLPCAVAADKDGRPVVTLVSGVSRLIQLPADIESLRQTVPSAALAWRRAVRDAVVLALSEGAVLRGLTAEGALVLEVPS